VRGLKRASSKGDKGEQLELPGARGDVAKERALAALSGAARDRALVRALVAWFTKSARDLPWRRRRDPYAVWLSEIMLQQTRVETVIPYFERFLSRYPTVSDLARAELDEVLSLWSGLGYYRRARELYKCAREVSERFAGVFPGRADELRALPGIGAYTAGAIASLAFGERTPLVDGNVARVFARLDGIEEPVKSGPALRRVWERAGALVPADAPGPFNEGLMELGAMVCTPRDPRCGVCPLSCLCVARASGRASELPVVEPKRKVPVVKMVAAVVRRDGDARVLFARGAEGGLFGGLGEPPMVEGGSVEAARASLLKVGVDGKVVLREVGRVKHVLTHRELSVVVAVGESSGKGRGLKEMALPYEKADWLDPGAPGVGVSTLARKVLRAAGD